MEERFPLKFKVDDMIEVNPENFWKSSEEDDPVPGDVGFVMETGIGRYGRGVGVAFPGERLYAGYAGEDAFVFHEEESGRSREYEIERAKASMMWVFCKIPPRTEDSVVCVRGIKKSDEISSITVKIETKTNKVLVKHFSYIWELEDWAGSAVSGWNCQGKIGILEDEQEGKKTMMLMTFLGGIIAMARMPPLLQP